MKKMYKVLLGTEFNEGLDVHWGFLYWSPIYRDVDYLVTDLEGMLEQGEDQLNCRFTLTEAKDHVERLKLKSKYNPVLIIEAAPETTKQYKLHRFDEAIIWSGE